MNDEHTQEVEEEPTEQPVVQEEIEEIEDVAQEEDPTVEVEEAREEPNRTQQRIAELVAQREEARRSAAELEKRLALHEDKDEPKEDDFDSYEEYTRATIKHETQQALKSERQADIEAQKAADGNLALQQFQVRAEAAREVHADFDAVVGNDSLPITQDMLQIMAESEVGADVAYHLGKNPAEAQRLSMMSPAMMGREMAMLEAKMSSKPAPSIPTPINTGINVSGVGESTVADISKMSTEDYIAARRNR